ncbi:MAG: photosynthetic complex putative assembly protein PuhB [Paracoccaceae bacterium]
MAHTHDDDFTEEPIRGLPARPPEGERILWQGEPSWRALAKRAFLTKIVAIWFGLWCAWTLAELATGREGLTEATAGLTLQVIQASIAIGILTLIAYGTAKTTVYTLTNRRLVMRIGMALDLTLNLPFRQIANLDLRAHGDGTGDLAVKLAGNDRIGYLHLWPHARPWCFNPAEPMLRSVPDAEHVGRLFADALREDIARREAEGEHPNQKIIRTVPRPLPPRGAMPAE